MKKYIMVYAVSLVVPETSCVIGEGYVIYVAVMNNIMKPTRPERSSLNK